MMPSLAEIRKHALVTLDAFLNGEPIGEARLQAAKTILDCLGSPSPEDFKQDRDVTGIERMAAMLTKQNGDAVALNGQKGGLS